MGFLEALFFFSAPSHLNKKFNFLNYWAAMAFYFHYFGKKITGSSVDKKKLKNFTIGLSRYYRKNIFKIPFVIKRLRKFASQYEIFFKKYDIILSPVTSNPAPKIGYLSAEPELKLLFNALKILYPLQHIKI